MKHLFIINPKAGKKPDPAALRAEIDSAMAARAEDYEIYVTKAPLDAAEKVRAEAAAGGELRVYACGGDGTLNECVNGAADFANAAVTNYACGSGNDFVRMFGEDAGRFTHLEELISGEVFPLDLIEACGRRSVNICSIGFDARVGTDVHKYTQNPLISGGFGYIVSLAVNLAKGVNCPLRLRVNGEERSGSFALACACNGRFYGGGFNPVPDAEPDDGLLDLLIVKAVSRLKFLTLVGKYAKGRYAEMKDVITHVRCTEAEFESEAPIPVNVDGELETASRILFKVIPRGIRFIVPRASAFARARQPVSSAN